VFISHQRADTSRGKRAAGLSDQCGLDCWLDVFDPTLALANQLPQHDPRGSVLIASEFVITNDELLDAATRQALGMISLSTPGGT
jgi:hypothetical protein